MNQGMDKTKLWSKDFVLATLAKTFSSMVFTLLTTTVATFSFAAYNANAGEAGIAVGSFILAALVSRFLIARYTEVIGRKRLLVISSLAFFVATLGYLLPVDFYGFLAVRVAHGLAFGIANNTLTVVATAYIPDERWGEGLGFFSLSATISSALGPFLGITLMQSLGFKAMFLACAVFAFLSFLPVCFMNIRPILLSERQRNEALHGFKLENYLEKAAVPLSILVLAMNLCYASVNSYISTYADTIGLERFASWFFVVYAAVLLISRPTMGKAMDRHGDNVVMYPALAALGLGYLLLAFLPNLPGLMVSAVFLAIGYGGAFSNIQAIVVRAAPSHRMGMATSTFYVFADAGLGFGPLVLGLLVPLCGYHGMYLAGGASAIILLALYFMLHGRKTKKGTGNAAGGAGAARSDSSHGPSFVVTIAREHGSGGREIGQALAADLNISFFGRDEVMAVAKEMGVADDFGKQMDDQTKSRMLYSLFLGSPESAQMREAQDAVFAEIASRGSCVVLGRAADSTYANVERRVSIFVHAPKGYKVERIMESYGDTQLQALESIDRSDKARSLYYSYVTGRVWGDPHNYDISFDASIGIGKSVQLIKDYLRVMGLLGEDCEITQV